MKNMTSKLLAFAFLAFIAIPAFAVSTNYTISGTGSGSLNGSAFSNQNFDINLIGDPAPSPTDINPLSSAEVSITGLGTMTFSLGTELGYNTSNQAVFFAGDGFADLFDFFAILPSNDLTGPFTVTGTGVFALNQFQNAPTSLGLLTFDTSSDVTFSASGSIPAIPEPETYAMMLAGLGLLGFVARRRKQKAA